MMKPQKELRSTLIWTTTKYAQEFRGNTKLREMEIRNNILRYNLYRINTNLPSSADKEDVIASMKEYNDYYDTVAEAHRISMIYSVAVSINNRFSERLFTLMYDRLNDRYEYEIPEVKKDNTKNEILEGYLNELCGIADYLSLELNENDTAEKIDRVCNKIRDLFNKNN